MNHFRERLKQIAPPAALLLATLALLAFWHTPSGAQKHSRNFYCLVFSSS